ncbi:MAG: hypothetical protein E7Y34_01680 [Mycoplasma sp.]|nr:hypothetical protein [Mycoplasma sp.]
MKNKKIILGLGTITALGAMSMGFVACVNKGELKDYVKKDELLKEIKTQEFLNDVKTAFTDKKDYDLLKFNAQWDKDSKVSKLVEEIEKLEGFKKANLEIAIDDAGKKADLKDGKHTLTIKRKGVDVSKTENSHLKVEKEFEFKLKA